MDVAYGGEGGRAPVEEALAADALGAILDGTTVEFLAVLGHELRNPLTAIRGALALARRDPTRGARALDVVARQAGQLEHLVDELLDVARITHGTLILRRSPVCLATVVEEACETVRSVFDDRGHTLVVSIADEIPAVEGEASRLEQVVTNLLLNAAKYTPAGGRIDVVLERRGDSAIVRVRDTGVGIAPALLPRIFDPFIRGDDGLERAPGGLGIGLAVVRRLVELHGGTVSARSDGQGRGAEFVVTLPLHGIPSLPHPTRPAT